MRKSYMVLTSLCFFVSLPSNAEWAANQRGVRIHGVLYTWTEVTPGYIKDDLSGLVWGPMVNQSDIKKIMKQNHFSMDGQTDSGEGYSYGQHAYAADLYCR